MVPLATPATVQPLWVQIALKALNSPALGWVTTTFVASKTLPPPTGMSATLITTLAEPAEPAAAPAEPPAVLPLLPPQAATAAAPTTPTPTTPAVRMTVRRSTSCPRMSGSVAGFSVVGSLPGWLTESSRFSLWLSTATLAVYPPNVANACEVHPPSGLPQPVAQPVPQPLR